MPCQPDSSGLFYSLDKRAWNMCHPVYSLVVLILKNVDQDDHYEWTSSAGTSFDKSALKAGVCVGTKSPVTAPRYHQFLENCKRNCQCYSLVGGEMLTKYILMIKRKRPAGHNGWGDLHQEQTEVAKAGHLLVIITLQCVFRWGLSILFWHSKYP